MTGRRKDSDELAIFSTLPKDKFDTPESLQRILEACKKYVAHMIRYLSKVPFSQDDKKDIAANVFSNLFGEIKDRKIKTRTDLFAVMETNTWRFVKAHQRDQARTLPLKSVIYRLPETRLTAIDWFEEIEYLKALARALAPYVTRALAELSAEGRDILLEHSYKVDEVGKEEDRETLRVRKRFRNILLMKLSLARRRTPGQELLAEATDLIRSHSATMLQMIVRDTSILVDISPVIDSIKTKIDSINKTLFEINSERLSTINKVKEALEREYGVT